MRAILLAAGMGTRLRPLTDTIPKSLIEVDGKPLIERQIQYLREIRIRDIFIVTGYLAHKFEYLRDKYNVTLVYNDKYNVYNNIYSMYLIRDQLHESYVIDADVFLRKNFLEAHLINSTYFGGKKENFTNEWVLYFDNLNKVYDIEIQSGRGYILSGVSYWNDRDGFFIKKELEKKIHIKGQFENLYWDNIVKDNLESLSVDIKKIDGNDWFEIDCLQDIENVKKITNV